MPDNIEITITRDEAITLQNFIGLLPIVQFRDDDQMIRVYAIYKIIKEALRESN